MKLSCSPQIPSNTTVFMEALDESDIGKNSMIYVYVHSKQNTKSTMAFQGTQKIIYF